MESDEDSDGSRVYFKLLAVVLNFYIYPVSLDFGIKHSIGFGTILSQSPEKEFIMVPPHKVLFPPLPYKHAVVLLGRLHDCTPRFPGRSGSFQLRGSQVGHLDPSPAQILVLHHKSRISTSNVFHDQCILFQEHRYPSGSFLLWVSTGRRRLVGWNGCIGWLVFDTS